MKRRNLILGPMAMAAFLLAPLSVHGEAQLSADNLNKLEDWGFFTPSFETAVHELVETKQTIITVKKEEKDLVQKLPDLKKQADDAEAKVAALRTELAQYDRTDETDFAQLKEKMADAGSKPDDMRPLAQAYVWTYPASPHQAEIQQYLSQLQKKMTDDAQAVKDAEAARIAARAQLVQRAQAKQLSLEEWRGFLRDMSRDDVLKYLGRPEFQTTDTWIYPNDWTQDPATHQKVGMQINFNAGRVSSVAIVPPH